jgi:hypothetical protein
MLRMKMQQVVSLVVALGLASAALAGDEGRTRMAIAMLNDGSGEDLRLEFDSDELGFNLHELQEGESRSVTDISGRNILITRESDEFTFNVDGKVIAMPLLKGGDHHGAWMGLGEPGDVDVHVVHDANITTMTGTNGVTILSGAPIDQGTRQAIQSLLESAGHGSDVRFVNAANPDGETHTLKLIEKRFETLQ